MTDDLEPGLASDSGERYERGERIATGGMGEVWRARDTVLGREVAVKILKTEYAEDPTFRARFEAEARHAAGLHHPGIASVFDYGMLREGNTPYLVMELVDGKPLADLLANGQPFDPEVARALGLQIAEALAVAHEAGVVHRDVKPGNVLVTPDGRVKITDFGIARATGSVAFTQTGQIVGTPHYLSPEQARGESATAASDVYALGVLLFECLSGHRPFTADTPIATALAQIQQDVPPLPDTVPPALAAVVIRALAKKPAERYADGGEIAEALREATPGATPPPAVVPSPDHTEVLAATAAPLAPPPVEPPVEPPVVPVTDAAEPRGRSRWPLYAAGLIVLVLLVALLIAHPWTQQGAATNDTGNKSSSGPNPDQGSTVRVRKGDYVGDPVDQVTAALHDKGLKTKVESQDNPGSENAGTVADLSPTGNVDKGSTITLQVWGDPQTNQPSDGTSQKPGKGNGNGNSGQGNGQGNGNGNGQGNDNPSQPPSTQQPGSNSGTGTNSGTGSGTGTGTNAGTGTDPGAGQSAAPGGRTLPEKKGR